MKQLLLLIAGFCFSLAILAQNVTQLDFPYKEGLQLNYEGEKKYFGADGEVRDTEEYSFAYEVFDHPDTGEDDIVRFKVFTASGDILSNSFLYTSKKGMVWWIEREGETEEVTKAIKLPLKPGKKWGGSFAGYKAKFSCIGTDLDIETKVGTKKGFGVQTVFFITQGDGTRLKSVVTEYYSQDLGKVRSEEQLYVEVAKKEYKLVMEDAMTVSSYQLPDGTKSN